MACFYAEITAFTGFIPAFTSIEISICSLTNLQLLGWWQSLLLAVDLLAIAAGVCACVRSGHELPWFSVSPEKAVTATAIQHRVWCACWLGVFVAAGAPYLLSNSIFVLSIFIPNSSGFESRTQGAIRFAAAFVIAVGAKLAHDALEPRRLKLLIALAASGLSVLFAGSIVGQWEAWVGAAHYNDVLLRDMDAAIRGANLNENVAFTFVADLPPSFPQQVNGERILGEAWDLGPALALLYPDSHITANVYEPMGTSIQADGVVLHGYWEAKYPFYFYRSGDGTIYPISNGGDFASLVARP